MAGPRLAPLRLTSDPRGEAQPGGDDAVQELYRLPLPGFTAARNALAARLQSSDRDAAARVKSLGKPTASAWAANQVFWGARREFDALIDASDRLRALQASGATANELRQAMRERREALTAVVRAGEAALKGGGHAASAGVVQRVATTFEALATYGSARPPAIRPGLLAEDLVPPGFDAMGALAPAVAPRPREPGPSAEPTDAAAAEREGDEARSRVERAQLEAELAATRRLAAAAETAAEEAAQRAEGAGSELAEAERRLAKAAERAREAEAAAKDARTAALRASRELAALERKLASPPE